MAEIGLLVAGVIGLVWAITATGSIERRLDRQAELMEKVVEHLEDIANGARDHGVEKSVDAFHRTFEAAFPHASRETRRFLREHGHFEDV